MLPADASFGRGERWLNLVAGLRHAHTVRQAFGTVRRRDVVAAGEMANTFRRLRSARVQSAGTKHRATAAVVFSSSGLSMPIGVNQVTFVEDMTISQVASLPGHFRAWTSFPPRYLADRAAQQAKQHRAAHNVAFLSSWAADAAVADYGLDPDRVEVIGVGSDFRPFDGRRDWLTPKFLFVGMDWARKNGDMVVESFREVRAKHPSAELHLVGRHPPVDEPGVVGHGLLAPSDPDARRKLNELYTSSTCFVLPSSLEPSAVSYAEACSQGVPSIGTVHGGSIDIFGDSGVAIDPSQRGALTAAMLDLADPDCAQSFGAIAVQRAPMLTWDAVARRLATASGWWDGPSIPLTRVTP